jgi:hypothetical protein
VRAEKKRDPKKEERGQFKMARALDAPLMMATMWPDNNVVDFLSTGAVYTPSTVDRTVVIDPKEPVVCPKSCEITTNTWVALIAMISCGCSGTRCRRVSAARNTTPFLDQSGISLRSTWDFKVLSF